MSTIERAEVFVASPGRNFVTLADHHVRRRHRPRATRRSTAGSWPSASYLRDHVVPLLIGKDPARIEDMWQYLYRGAYWRARPGDDDRDRRRRHRAVGHQGQGRRAAGLPAARRRGPATASWSTRHASGTDVAVAARRRRPLPRARLPGDPGPGRGPGHRRHLRGAQGHASTSRPRPSLPDEQPWSTEAYLNFAPTYLRGRARAVRVRLPPAARRAPPAHARSRPPGSARRSRTAGCSGWRTRPRRRTRRRSG